MSAIVLAVAPESEGLRALATARHTGAFRNILLWITCGPWAEVNPKIAVDAYVAARFVAAMQRDGWTREAAQHGGVVAAAPADAADARCGAGAPQTLRLS